jgi:SAM-dependent methyltransferase
MSSPNAREVKYWNSAATRPWATQYDAIDRLFHEITRAALDAAEARPGERVLDVGCGSGTTVLALAAAVAPAGRVLGIDVAEESVMQARRRIAESQAANAEVMMADASTQDFPQRFDLMFSRFGVMFFGDPLATFTRLRQAMQPAGRLSLVVWRTAAENAWASAAVKALAQVVAPPPPPEPEAPGPFSWADPARVRRILEGAGYRDVSLTPRDFSLQIAPRGGAAAATQFAMSVGPVVRLLADAPESLRRKIRAALGEFFRGIDGPKGIVLPGAVWIVGAKAVIPEQAGIQTVIPA